MKEVIPIPYLELDSSESPDWDFARNRRILLRTPISEYSSSVLSAKVELPNGDEFIVPNRDFGSEGLSFLNRGDPWKVLDGVGIALSSGGENWKLLPAKVVVSPIRASYQYMSKQQEVMVRYSLGDVGAVDVSSLCLEIGLPDRTSETVFRIYLLLDLRPLRRESAPPIIDPLMTNNFVCRNENIYVSIASDMKTDSSHAVLTRLDWIYKKGFGSRRQTPDGVKSVPYSSTLSVVGPYELKPSGSNSVLQLLVTTGFPVGKDAPRKILDSIELFESNLRGLLSLLPFETVNESVRNALYGRICSMLLFGIRVDLGDRQLIAGEAGAWWFRRSWLRDVYEGLLWNRNVLSILGLQHYMASQLEIGLRHVNEFGLLPNLIDWRSDGPLVLYNSLDSTLLFHQFLMEYCRSIGNLRGLRSGVSLLIRFIQSLEKKEIPEIKESDGALLCPASYSWTDSKVDIEIGGEKLRHVSTRMPPSFYDWILTQESDLNKAIGLIEGPNFVLPEIQARWILVLDKASRVSADLGLDPGPFKIALEKATRAFERQFLCDSEDLPANCLFIHNDIEWKDQTLSSPSFISMTLLKDLLPRQSLKRAYDKARSELVVSRRIMKLNPRKEAPFGLLTQKRQCGPYLDDEQYHGCVVWPRDTPYLLDAMTYLGLEEDSNLLLLNNLDVSLSECVPFYSNELYGLPLGKNPSPEEETKLQPIPLKNPAQWWSNWVDPYLSWALA